MRILALRVKLFVPSAGLFAKIGYETGEHFELRKAREGFDSASELQKQLQVIDRPNKFGNPFDLPRSISPRSMCATANIHRLIAQLRAERVLVKSSKATNCLLDLDEYSFSDLDDGRNRE